MYVRGGAVGRPGGFTNVDMMAAGAKMLCVPYSKENENKDSR
jgi:hypothetical protein